MLREFVIKWYYLVLSTVFKLENLKAELDETRLSEKQLRHKVEHQKEIIAAKSEELHIMSERVHETMSSEMLSLQLELTELESVKVSD